MVVRISQCRFEFHPDDFDRPADCVFALNESGTIGSPVLVSTETIFIEQGV